MNFLGWKAAVRKERGLPIDCSPPPRTPYADWWWDLVKRDRIEPERLHGMYRAFLADDTYRIGKEKRLLAEAAPAYPITAFVENWPYWDTIASMPARQRGAA